MIIDFHTHIFPDKIAEKTISALASSATATAYTNGTLNGLKESMEKAGVDLSVILPVMTKPSQFDGINAFARAVNENFVFGESKVLSFAGIHPDCENLKDKMDFIVDAGFKGIKIHPEYQNAYIDDERNIQIMALAKERGLITVTHAGVDRAFLDTPVKCTPRRVKRALEILGGYEKLVLAHLGGCEMSEEVYRVIASEDIYFDTAHILKETSEQTFKKIMQKKGADKILFATDSPWSSPDGDIKIIKSFALDGEDERKIFAENAIKLLGLEK